MNICILLNILLKTIIFKNFNFFIYKFWLIFDEFLYLKKGLCLSLLTLNSSYILQGFSRKFNLNYIKQNKIRKPIIF